MGAVVLAAFTTYLLHDWVHNQFHLTNTSLDRWGWFQRLRELHFVHHRRMNRNLGVFWFGWDRIFRTFYPNDP
jgi:sterol desaturase/sphingolipid hydroxylase (fatty acid hydroxylase superfamily)